MGWWFPNIDKIDKELVKKIKKYYTEVDIYNQKAETYTDILYYLVSMKKDLKKSENMVNYYKEKLANLELNIIPKDYEYSINLKNKADYIKNGLFGDEIKRETELRISKLEKPESNDVNAVRKYKAKCKIIKEMVENEISLQKQMELVDIKDKITNDKMYSFHVKIQQQLIDYTNKLEEAEKKVAHYTNSIEKNIGHCEEAHKYCEEHRIELAQLYSEIKKSLPKEFFEKLDLEEMVILKDSNNKILEEPESNMLTK